jgi:hypothetical protein
VNRGLIRALILLPGTVLVFIPAVILWAAKDSMLSARLATADQFLFWLALIAGGIGLGLSFWTTAIFGNVPI